MGFALTTADYVDYMKLAYARIHENGDYVTALDAATGDGDHWTNMDSGFGKLMEMTDELCELGLSDAMKKIGMTMMSVIGGSGGALYGSAYLEAAKVLQGCDAIDSGTLCSMLEAMLAGIMKRGKGVPGDKTMIDALYPAVQQYKTCVTEGIGERETLAAVKQAAIDGAQSTLDMEAVRGRAYYQSNKGVGHLDPGAVTMAYQIETLAGYIIASKL